MFIVDQKHPPSSFCELFMQKIKGCCIVHSNAYDFEPKSFNDEGRMHLTCQGHIFGDDFQFMSQFGPNSENTTIQFKNINKSTISLKNGRNSLTLNEIKREIGKNIKLGNDDFVHMLACIKIGPFEYKNNLTKFEPGSYFVALHNDKAKGLLSFINPINPTLPKNEKLTVLHQMTTMFVYQGNQKKSIEIDCSLNINNLIRTIANEYGDSNYEDFTIYTGHSVHYTLSHPINSFDCDCFLFTTVSHQKCKQQSNSGNSVLLMNYTSNFAPGEECPFTSEGYRNYLVQASPCNHKFSLQALSLYITKNNVRDIICKNTNPETKSFEYLITCPICAQGNSNKIFTNIGAITFDSIRFDPNIYSMVKEYANEFEHRANGEVFCQLKSHNPNCRWFTPEETTTNDHVSV